MPKGRIDRHKLDATTEAEFAVQQAEDDADAMQDAACFVRRVRRRLGLTQQEFARRIDVPLDTIRNWEQGKRYPTGAAGALLKMLDRVPKVALRQACGHSCGRPQTELRHSADGPRPPVHLLNNRIARADPCMTTRGNAPTRIDVHRKSDRGLPMENIAQQAAIVAGVVAACVSGPALGTGVLLLRRRRARVRRRTPIVDALLRAPGHTLRRQLDDASIDLQWDVFTLAVMPLMILALFLAQAQLLDDLATTMRLAPIYAAGALAFVGLAIRKLWKAGQRLDNLRAGLDAELAVGQELDQLMRQGATVFHDVPANAFNIDHVVVSTEGVFAVETKGFTKPMRGMGAADASVEFDGSVLRFPTWLAREPLMQAERQAIWLSKWLSDALGTSIRVMPVLALPGWYVRRTGRGSVRVYSGKELAGLMKARGAQALSAQDVQRVAHQIGQRCRTVEPLLGEAKRAA